MKEDEDDYDAETRTCRSDRVLQYRQILDSEIANLVSGVNQKKALRRRRYRVVRQRYVGVVALTPYGRRSRRRRRCRNVDGICRLFNAIDDVK